MAERQVRVLAVADAELQLQLLGSHCDGCVGGCGGRCNLFSGDGERVFRLATPAARDYRAGQQLRLQLDDAVMRRAAWRGYGLAWVGLLAGAGLGAAIGVAWGQYANLLTLCGLLLGTFLGPRFSNRHVPGPVLAPSGPDPSFDNGTSNPP